MGQNTVYQKLLQYPLWKPFQLSGSSFLQPRFFNIRKASLTVKHILSPFVKSGGPSLICNLLNGLTALLGTLRPLVQQGLVQHCHNNIRHLVQTLELAR